MSPSVSGFPAEGRVLPQGRVRSHPPSRGDASENMVLGSGSGIRFQSELNMRGRHSSGQLTAHEFLNSGCRSRVWRRCHTRSLAARRRSHLARSLPPKWPSLARDIAPVPLPPPSHQLTLLLLPFTLFPSHLPSSSFLSPLSILSLLPSPFLFFPSHFSLLPTPFHLFIFLAFLTLLFLSLLLFSLLPFFLLVPTLLPPALNPLSFPPLYLPPSPRHATRKNR